MNRNIFIILLSLISAALLAIVMMKAPQGINDDSSYQVKALQQYLSGESPSINHLVTADESDLSKDKLKWICQWPFGTELLIYPLIVKGVALGDAIRVIVLVSIFVGTVGWISWFSLFRIPLWIMITLAVTFPWLRYSSSNLFLYSTEVLVYSATPWILLIAYVLSRILEKLIDIPVKYFFLFALFGFFLGIVYTLKYSVIFYSFGALVYLGTIVHRLKEKRYLMCFL